MRLLLLAIILSSCGSSYHLKRMAHHEAKAIAKGAIIKIDTVYGLKKFTFPAVNVKFEPKLISESDKYRPFILVRDSIQVKVEYRKGVNGIDTVYVDAKIPEKEVTAKVPISIEKKIEPRDRRSWPWVLLIGIAIGCAATIWITRTLSIQVRRL